MKPDDARNV